MSRLNTLRSRLRARIHTARTLLTEMAPPIQTLAQEIAYEGNLTRVREMTLDVTTDLLDIDVDYVDNIDPTELENWKADLKDIERRTSTVNTVFSFSFIKFV